MDSRYRFRIANSYTPETLPMERLAEYLAAFARLLGEPASVHFQTVEAGSAVLVVEVDQPAQPRVDQRVHGVKNGTAPKDAMKSYSDLDEMLRKDNAKGDLTGDNGAIILLFPGVDRPAPLVFGPFKQDGSLEGQVIRVGGKDETIPVHLRDGAIIHIGLNATPEIARKIAQYYLGPTLRVHGTGTWFREADGTWLLKSFKIVEFEVLDEAPLRDVVSSLRKVMGSTWHEVPDAVRTLLEERHGDGSTS